MAYSIDRMPERISIGRETETGVTDVMIDCGAWVSKWPGMTLHAIHTPEGGAPYILQTETDGGVLVWHVTDADTATPGTGLVEIVGETDGRRKVSAMVKVFVASRMDGTVGEPPNAANPWADRVVEAAERITGMKVQAETLAAGIGATAAWDGQQGLLKIGVPKGEQGPKGEKGEKGPQGEKGEPGKDAVVDATLTQSGQAADAKATGDAVSQLKGDTAHIYTLLEEEHTYLFDDVEWNINKVISASSGNVTTYQNYYLSPMIPIKDGAVITYNGLQQPDIYRAILAYYNSAEEFVSAVNAQSNTVQSGTVTAPAGARFVRFSTYKSTNSGTVYVSVRISSTTKEVVTDLLNERIKKVEQDTVGFFNGKKAVFLGDSITEGMSPEYTTGHTTCGEMHKHGDKIYWEIASELIGMSCIGYGVTGTTIKGNTGTIGAPFVDRYKDMDVDADVVCVFGGTNDFGLSSTLGTINDQPDKNATFYSALKYLLIGLYAKYPNARFIFCTPTPRFETASVASSTELSKARKHFLTQTTDTGLWYYYNWDTQEWTEDTAYNEAIANGENVENYDHTYLAQKMKNNKGTSLSEYVDAIRSVCAMYSVPVCDFNAMSRIYPYTAKYRYDNIGDGLHPHSNQHMIMGRLLANAIREKC